MTTFAFAIFFLSSGGIVSGIVDVLSDWIAKYGYPAVFGAGVFFLTPTELVFPLVGYTVNVHNLGIGHAIGMGVIGGLGATVGAAILYYLSRKLGIAAIEKFGKYIRMSASDLQRSEKWFSRYGSITVFACRMVPGIREIISIPAGISKMNFTKFIIYTFFGSVIWCVTWTLIGFYFADSWKILSEQLSHVLDIAALIIIIIIIGVFLFKHFRKRNSKLFSI
jgi:membrane protein DedA with SNARE-associated domain